METAAELKKMHERCIEICKENSKHFAKVDEKQAIADTRLAAIDGWKVIQNGALIKLNESIMELCKMQAGIELKIVQEISALRNDMNEAKSGKPSWATLYIMSFLSAVAVGAVVALIRVL